MTVRSYQKVVAAKLFRAALLTPRGRGAVATIRILGEHTLLDQESPLVFRAANGRPLSEQPCGRIVYGNWGRDFREDVVLCRIDALTLEIHCHGGDRAADRILHDWQDIGAEICGWQQLTASTLDVLETEIQESLSRTVTWRTAEYVLSQADGRLRSAYQKLREIEWSDAGRQQAEQIISELLRWASFGVHLTEPWRVVLTGRPNVGKSSLINALLGYQRSIVFDQPGTTRDVVTATTAFDGWPVQLADTAGLRSSTESLETEGIVRARQQLADADLIVELIDFSQGEDQWASAARRAEELRSDPCDSEIDRSPLLVAHKCDLSDRWGPAIPAEAFRVSSITGAGVEDLQREIIRRLVPVAPPLETPVPITPRQVAALRALERALTGGAKPDFSGVLISGETFLTS